MRTTDMHIADIESISLRIIQMNARKSQDSVIFVCERESQ